MAPKSRRSPRFGIESPERFTILPTCFGSFCYTCQLVSVSQEQSIHGLASQSLDQGSRCRWRRCVFHVIYLPISGCLEALGSGFPGSESGFPNGPAFSSASMELCFGAQLPGVRRTVHRGVDGSPIKNIHSQSQEPRKKGPNNAQEIWSMHPCITSQTADFLPSWPRQMASVSDSHPGRWFYAVASTAWHCPMTGNVGRT